MKNKIKKLIIMLLILSIAVIAFGCNSYVKKEYIQQNIQEETTEKLNKTKDECVEENKEIDNTINNEILVSEQEEGTIQSKNKNTVKFKMSDELNKKYENELNEIKEQNESNTTNVLLIGIDKRPNDEENTRSDSIILVNINSNGTVELVSFMRDLYVKIPGHQDNRINASYRFGGAELLKETIETNFDIEIDNTVEIDFSGFEKVIDEIGGVEIEINEKEAEIINDDAYNENAVVVPGKNKLNGKQALVYARIRKVGNGDFERTERQRTILIESAKKIKNLNVFEIIKLYNSIKDVMKTDLTYQEIIKLLPICMKVDFDSMETYNIPEDATFSEETVRKMAVLVPDIDACKNKLTELGIRVLKIEGEE